MGKMSSNQSITIVMPCFNEEGVIIDSLTSLVNFFNKDKVDIIVVDDGSEDRTASLVKAFIGKNHNVRLIQNDRNYGKGYSVRRGMMESRSEKCLYLDADIPIPLNDIDKMLSWLDVGYDVIIGSRLAKGAQVTRSAYRKIFGLIYNKVISIILLPGVKDTQCGVKCFSAGSVKKCFSGAVLNDYSFDAEILSNAKANSLKIMEVPVKWSDKARKSSVNVVSDGFRMVASIILFKMRHVNIPFKQ